ncbi:hypothetical protein MFUL124B02_33860 [Myxococcus fulvus 124B02]|nr:hypothetical protein MFUL124B02_33860 [Myxococcus fulvus 124B02]
MATSARRAPGGRFGPARTDFIRALGLDAAAYLRLAAIT